MENRRNSSEIPLRALGRTGVQVTAIGFGGYHLGLMKDDNEAIRLAHEAIDSGITFLDNAWEYQWEYQDDREIRRPGRQGATRVPGAR